MALTVQPASPGAVVLETTTDETLLAGRPLFRGSVDDLLIEFERLIDRGGAHLVVTPNVDLTLTLRDDPAFRSAYDAATVRLVDGAPLLALARLLGDRSVERLTGADLVPVVVEWAARRGRTVAVVGGGPGVAEEAARRLEREHPGARVQPVPFPFLDSVDDLRAEEVVDRLTSIRPDVTFVCLGAPKQERWISAWLERLPDGVYVGAGAAVDFAAGRVRRAPTLVRQAGAEWVWRLLQEPRRLAHRYLVRGPAFVTVVVASCRRHRWRVR